MAPADQENNVQQPARRVFQSKKKVKIHFPHLNANEHCSHISTTVECQDEIPGEKKLHGDDGCEYFERQKKMAPLHFGLDSKQWPLSTFSKELKWVTYLSRKWTCKWWTGIPPSCCLDVQVTWRFATQPEKERKNGNCCRWTALHTVSSIKTNSNVKVRKQKKTNKHDGRMADEMKWNVRSRRPVGNLWARPAVGPSNTTDDGGSAQRTRSQTRRQFKLNHSQARLWFLFDKRFWTLTFYELNELF